VNSPAETTKRWLVAGASRGLGRAIAEAALERGHLVAAGARDPAPLADLSARHGTRLVTLALDVTDRAAVEAAVVRTEQAFGGLDVLVNSAGHAVLGAIEEANETTARAQLETNFFGSLWTTQAVLPGMRRQQHGRIIQISSIGGVLAFPMVGLYNASKWALEGMSESLSHEVAQFGIKVTLVEPGALRTDWPQDSIVRTRSLEAYNATLVERLALMRDEFEGRQPGDPRRVAEAILELTDLPNPPLRVLMGNAAFELATEHYHARLREWAAHEAIARSTDFPSEGSSVASSPARSMR
jgi:NAD(P)-dependent dehydrogenase (short-subunit alcohol dehydrogenase family)